MSENVVSKFHVKTLSKKKISRILKWGCLEIYRPPAGDRVDLFPTRVEEGIVRGLTFADLLRDAYLTMRVVHTQEISANCRGVCAGVTQFVVTNEHNMIMSPWPGSRDIQPDLLRFVSRGSLRATPQLRRVICSRLSIRHR